MKFSFPLVLSLFLSLSCGKDHKSSPESVISPVVPESELDNFLSKQEVLCAEGASCPNFIAKIVIVNDGQVKFCTGTLINESTVLTSASCIPESLRSVDRDCSKSIHLFFNKGTRPPERVLCSNMTQVSSLAGSDPALWRDDLAFIKLQRPLYSRSRKAISREGLDDGKKLTHITIEQDGLYSGMIRRNDCEAVHNTFLNPLASDYSSPNGIFFGCKMSEGFSGAPLLDNKGRIRAVSSLPLSQKLINDLTASGLMLKPLRPILHVTNMACAPTPNNTEVLDERECSKELEVSVIDRKRGEMLMPENAFAEIISTIQDNADLSNKYLKFSVYLTQIDNEFKVDILPKCFKNTNSWIGEISSKKYFTFQSTLEQKTLKKGIDAFGRVQGQETAASRQAFNLQFFPKTLKASQKTDVYMWKGNETALKVDNVPHCSLL